MSNNKQTAVEWLIKNLMINGLIRLTQDQHSLYKELTEEAKAMEREQIEDAFLTGGNSVFNFQRGNSFQTIEDYTEQTYKSE